MSRAIYEEVRVVTTGGTDVLRNASSVERDLTLYIYDSDGIERRKYAPGYWLKALSVGEARRRPTRRN